MIDEKTRSICRFGSICCFVAGFFYVLICICAFILPSPIATYTPSQEYFDVFSSFKPIFIALQWFMIFSSLAMIGIVSAFFALCREEHYGIMSWITVIAFIGHGISLYQSVIDMTIIPKLVEGYLNGGPIIQEVISTLGFATPELYILSMGLPGVWFIVVSIKAVTNRFIPRMLVILGLLWGVGGVLTAIAHTFMYLPLIYLIAIGAFIFAPIWSIWEGIFLHKVSMKGLQYSKKSCS